MTLRQQGSPKQSGLRIRGDPKWLVRGGGTSSGIVSVGKRLQPAPQPFEFRLFDAGAGAAGIDQPSVRIVVRESNAPSRGRRPSGSVQPTTRAPQTPGNSAAFTTPTRYQADSIMD
jgi:hypothetical protein